MDQTALRNQMLKIVLRALDSGEVTLIQAAVACMGVTATALGTMPPDVREKVALELEGKLLEHANARAAEIRSGEFDASIAEQ